MPRLRARAAFVGAVLVLVASWLPSARAAESSDPVVRLLFVGNSYTRLNELPRMVRRLAASIPNGRRVRSHFAFGAGATLEWHWEQGGVLRRMRWGGYSHIILQGHSLAALERPDSLMRDARRFAEEAREIGARTILLQTWARKEGHELYRKQGMPKSPEAMQARTNAVYETAARGEEAKIAPVGVAWQRALRQRPDLRLHRPDGSHPTLRGSYLAACVLYLAIVPDADLASASYHPEEIDEAEAELLRDIAAATVRESEAH